MQRVFSLLVVGITLSLVSCNKDRISGNGSVETEARNVSNFTSISAFGSSNVHITKGPDFKVDVTGYENLIAYYDTKLVNGELRLGYRNNVNIKNDNIEVYITMPELNGLKTNGSGGINTLGNFSGNDNFEAAIAGSGNITIAQGSTQNFSSSIAGSGNINAINMIAEKADITTSGSGNTEITANTHLKVRISGSGNVYYNGSPLVTVNIAGSGAVLPK